MIWWFQRRFQLQKKLKKDSNEESVKNFRVQFCGEESNEKSGEDSDKESNENRDEKFDEESYENEAYKKWDGFTDNSCADVNFLKKMIQSFIFEQIAMTEHRLIHFNVSLRKYQGRTQIS